MILTLSSELPFKKHKGELVRDVIESDPTYIDWLMGEKLIELDSETLSVLRDRLERA